MDKNTSSVKLIWMKSVQTVTAELRQDTTQGCNSYSLARISAEEPKLPEPMNNVAFVRHLRQHQLFWHTVTMSLVSHLVIVL